jgi:hypothetical protein
MNYAELQAKIIDQSHRKDMASRVPGFIDDARTRINYRLSLELVPLAADTDTNDVLTSNPLLYFYPAMQALYEFIFEFETANYFMNLWQQEVAEYYVNRAGTEPLVITPEGPTP